MARQDVHFRLEAGTGDIDDCYIDAVERLIAEPDSSAFHVVAFGSGDYRREYGSLINARGLSGRITLRDFVPDLARVLPQFDLVVEQRTNAEIENPFGTCGSQPFGRAMVSALLSTAGVA